MKRYVPIIIGIVALGAVLYVGSDRMNKSDSLATDEQKSTVETTTFSGKVTREFEGENTLEYSFDIPVTATTTVEKDGALIKIADNNAPLIAMYVSYEGGRGYSPADYISNVIVKSVKAITEVGTTTIGTHDWDVVESEWSVWHVAKAANGNWLLVVENKKVDNQKAEALIQSLVTK